jgi:selenide,water dikinase
MLVLTKPLGGGVTTTALKQEKAIDRDVKEAIEWMLRLNKTAGQLAVEFDLRGGTDITGFGLLGHGMEMADDSGVSLHIEYAKLPFLSGARGYAEKGIFPGGAFDNKRHFEKKVQFDQKLDEPAQMVLFDPQTSGGLLLGLPREKLAAFENRAKELNQPIWVIGEVHAGQGIEVRSQCSVSVC